MKTSAWTGFGGVACLGVAIACGGDEVAAPSAASAPHVAATEGAENQPPRVERLRLDPSDPMPGDTLRALANVRDPDGDRDPAAEGLKRLNLPQACRQSPRHCLSPSGLC